MFNPSVTNPDRPKNVLETLDFVIYCSNKKLGNADKEKENPHQLFSRLHPDGSDEERDAESTYIFKLVRLSALFLPLPLHLLPPLPVFLFSEILRFSTSHSIIVLLRSASVMVSVM